MCKWHKLAIHCFWIGVYEETLVWLNIHLYIQYTHAHTHTYIDEKGLLMNCIVLASLFIALIFLLILLNFFGEGVHTGSG